MPWCPKCKNEYREGITVCADCNVPLVEDFSAAIAADKTLVFNTEHKDKIDAFIKYLEYSGIHSYSVEEDGYNAVFTKTGDVLSVEEASDGKILKIH